MKRTACERCAGEFPLGDTYDVYGKTLCQDCADRELRERSRSRKPIEDSRINRNTDPTVCAKCGFDNGGEELETAGGIPFCPRCHQGMLRRPFPGWVKVAFAIVLALAAYSLARNMRFIRGYVEMKQAARAADALDLEGAVRLTQAAAGHVPESREVQAVADFYRALYLITVEDDCTEALRLLERCESVFGPEIAPVKRSAEAGAAFERKDYDAFLQKQLELLELSGEEPMAFAGVASAYACKYADTGEERFREKALQYLAKAEELAPLGDEGLAEYKKRIMHRIESREIISAKEYQEKFGSEDSSDR
jgi:hypothetical protein